MKRNSLSLLLILAFIVSSCSLFQESTPIPAAVVTETPALPPSPTPTPAPRNLTICLGDEPNTLYPYGSPNSAARSVMSAIYDGPVDTVGYTYSPIIVEKIPNIKDGDAQVNTVKVKAGDTVVDSSGNLTKLKTGDIVRPVACRSDACAIKYDGSSQIDMDQMVVTFTMLKGLTWSDGEPLTSSDSVYSFKLASSADTPGSKYLIDRTQSYEAADDQTIQWWGMPGYIDPEYYTNFWIPLPEHLLSQFPTKDLPKVDIASRSPIGWGPYVLQEWKSGEYIKFKKNLNYFRANEGLPKFDNLTFIFRPDENEAITALVQGKCDLLDPSIRLDGQVGLLQQMQTDRQAKLYTSQTMTMEWLGFGIVPASYDDGYNVSSKKDRPDFFGDKRLRQAIAYCLDRKKVVDTVLYGLSTVPNTYLPTDHPVNNPTVQTYAYDPKTGISILHDMGWVDEDGNPATPRKSVGVSHIPNGTPLILNYITSAATQRRQTEDILQQSLTQCGIGINPIYYSAADLYAGGPTGPLFGRQFDLAEYAIGVNSLEPTCNWFTASQVPTAANHWVGTNISGYKNPEFDAACKQGLQSLPDDPEYTAHQKAQSIFATDFPSIPLYMRLKVAATRFDFCGFKLDSTSDSVLAGLESFDYGQGCKP